MDDKTKKELLKLIDQIAAAKQKINDINEERNKCNAKWEAELSKLYTDLDSYYEKKRLHENAYLDSLV